ncbi:MAG: class I SAM-dependent methyltransferase [Phormidesmis sp.]
MTLLPSLSALKRYSLLIPEALIGGPSYARYMFWSKCSKRLDPKTIWDKFTKPANPLYEALLTHYPPGFARQMISDIYVAQLDRIAGVSQHYDISNDFYQLFLDQSYMFYTCADFLNSTDTLEEAQENKANYLLQLIDPQAGESILDVGCGWGSMMKKIYDTTGDAENLIGYTLSSEQKSFIESTYGFNVEYKDFVTANYKPQSLDKIYSIGAVEHIPKAQLFSVAQQFAEAIRPTGRIVHHFFCQLSETLPARLLAAADVFPGAELASLRQHLDTFERAGLQVRHHSFHDYRPTLEAWFNRLVAHETEAIRLVGLQNYNKYLCYLAEAWRLFENRDLVLTRFLLQRQDAPVKWTTSVPRATETAIYQPVPN